MTDETRPAAAPPGHDPDNPDCRCDRCWAIRTRQEWPRSRAAAPPVEPGTTTSKPGCAHIGCIGLASCIAVPVAGLADFDGGHSIAPDGTPYWSEPRPADLDQWLIAEAPLLRDAYVAYVVARVDSERAAAPPVEPDHEHYWIDAPDDETGWYCTICHLTEYPGDPGIGVPPPAPVAGLREADPNARLGPTPMTSAGQRLLARMANPVIHGQGSTHSDIADMEWRRIINEIEHGAWQLGAHETRAALLDSGGLDVERLATVLHDWMPDGAGVSIGFDGETAHLTGADLARFIFDRAAEYARLSEGAP